MRVEPHNTPEELAELARREPRAKVSRRLLAVRAAMLGRVAAQVAAEALLCERQVRGWVARYNAGGVGALADRPGRGRKAPLTPEQGSRLAERLAAGPTESDGVCALRGGDIRRILAEEFGVARRQAAVYVILRKLGFGPLRPRPAHPRADPAARAAFKKVSPASSSGSGPPTLGRASRSGPPTLGRASRSGSRARPGSARRAP